MAGLKIYANLDATGLTTARVISDTDLRAKAFKPFVAGDSLVVDVYLTGQSGLLNIQDYPTRRLGIGSINARPTGGTWDLGTQTGLAYDISASALDTAITAEVAACTVTQLTPFVFKVVFDANGDQTIPTVDATGLTPSSTVSISTLVAGDGSTPEEWIIRLFQNPIALIDSWTEISGQGIRGSFNLGTEGVYDLLAAADSVASTIELELTDSDGDITTVFQTPCSITGEVIGQGVTGVATFDSYATSSQLSAAGQRGNLVFVDADYGSDSSGEAYRADKPYLTCTAALAAASSGDLIVVRPGDYSGESALAGADGVNWLFLDGATSPSFNVSGAFTFTIDGDVGGFLSMATSAVSVTLNGSVGSYVSVTNGNLNINQAEWSHDGTTREPIYLGSSGSLNLRDSNITSTESGGSVVLFGSGWSGSFFGKNSELIATTVATNEATNGVSYSAPNTGTVQLKDCTIITAQDGTGTAKSIDAPAAQTVYIQGTLSQTHAVDADVTLAGGNSITNTNFTA